MTIGRNYWRILSALVLCALPAKSQYSIQVDDSNVFSPSSLGGIQFSATGWETSQPEGRFSRTYTSSSTGGANLMYSFRGNSIAYYADKGPGMGMVTVSLDGQSAVNVTWSNVGTTTQYQQLMWSATGLDSGDHQITLSNIGANVSTTLNTMGLDYFEVGIANPTDTIVPQLLGPAASNVPEDAVLIDDENTMISYAGAWKRFSGGASPDQGFYFNASLHSSITPGDFLTFTFDGTGVWYFSDDFPGNSKVSISVDGGPPWLVDTATTGSLWITQKLFWGVSNLSAGQHVVKVTHVGAQGDYANLDFFRYMPSSGSPTMSGTGSFPSSTTRSTNSGSKQPFPVGAVVGGTIGGVLFLAVFIGLLLYWTKHRSPKNNNSGPNHEAYSGGAAYHSNEAKMEYPSSPAQVAPLSYQPHSPHTSWTQSPNPGTGHSIAPSNWTGPTYNGCPEPQA